MKSVQEWVQSAQHRLEGYTQQGLLRMVEAVRAEAIEHFAQECAVKLREHAESITISNRYNKALNRNAFKEAAEIVEALARPDDGGLLHDAVPFVDPPVGRVGYTRLVHIDERHEPVCPVCGLIR